MYSLQKAILSTIIEKPLYNTSGIFSVQEFKYFYVQYLVFLCIGCMTFFSGIHLFF